MAKKRFNIKTDLLTIEKVFDVLKDSGLEHLLMGANEDKEVNTAEIFFKLFRDKKLRKLLSVVTGGQVKKDDPIEQDEAVQILQGFFLAFLKTWTMQNFLPQAT